jgi:hypothetical protein
MRLAIAAAAALLFAMSVSTEAKPRTMWEGGFMGGRWVEESDFSPGWSARSRKDRDRTVKRTYYHREHRFFVSSRACEAWLYQMRSTWQDMPRYSWCKRVRVTVER